jgi:processive 1,2-diacylglycerol beta-glucosyltransferase
MVLTISFGSGHVRAADAVAAAVGRQCPDTQVLTVDALTGSSLLFRAVYVWPYWLMLRYAPTLWRWLFAGRLQRRIRHTAPPWAFRWGCRGAFATIRHFDPDVIVAVEVGANEIACLARRSGQASAAVLAVITDRQAEPAWVHADVDGYVVPDPAVAAQLREWGALCDRISVYGIPVDAAFTDARARPDDVETPPDRLVLLMGGGMGPTRMDVVVQELVHRAVPMRIVAVAGKDRRTARRLSMISSTGSVTVETRGWVDDVAALMRQATVLVTKPGGVTTAEAAAMGLPVVLFNAIPGPEEVNAARVVASGAGVSTAGGAATADAVVDLIAKPATLQRMQARSFRTAKPDAAPRIAEFAIRLASSRAQSRHAVARVPRPHDEPVVAMSSTAAVEAGG